MFDFRVATQAGDAGPGRTDRAVPSAARNTAAPSARRPRPPGHGQGTPRAHRRSGAHDKSCPRSAAFLARHLRPPPPPAPGAAPQASPEQRRARHVLSRPGQRKAGSREEGAASRSRAGSAAACGRGAPAQPPRPRPRRRREEEGACARGPLARPSHPAAHGREEGESG